MKSAAAASPAASAKAKERSYKLKMIGRNWDLYLLILPTVIFFIIFKYVPMYGIQIAFRDFIPSEGIWGSEWVGWDNFNRFFSSPYFKSSLWNTVSLSFLNQFINFPFPIILALLLNQCETKWYKKTVQTVSYAPYFISVVVMVGLLQFFLSPVSGPVNAIIKALGGDPINFMGEPGMFKWIYVFSDTWQNSGYNAVIYIAALAGISPEYYEAAMVDGATKFKRMIYIDIPFLMPTICVLFILGAGRIMSMGFEKAFLMQNSLNLEKSEIIATLVYKYGMIQSDFGLSTAVSLFNTVVNLIFIVTVNWVTGKLSSGENSLW
ncbi:MAG: ABC transporter permease subunit [Oscillospiraceae bacterium]|nr:ABC transporter permease subunit [Oscillospiraceae bacterium]